jgi:arsenate reductase
MTLYHNAKCSKSRATLELLKGKDVKVINYLEAPPSLEELREIVAKLGFTHPKELMRTGESVFKENQALLSEKNDTETLKFMVENPIVIERPILVTEERAVIGRPPERVLELI